MKRKAITTIAVLVIMVSMLLVGFGGTQVAATSVSMQGYWQFDEGFCNIAYDSSDNHNDGILPGGKFGDALNFNSPTAHVYCGNDASLNIAQGTWEAWMKFDALPSQGTMMNPIAKANQYWIHASNGADDPYDTVTITYADSIQAKITIGGTRYIATTAANFIEVGQWYHVAGTYDGTNLKLFIDGIEIDSIATPGENIATSSNQFTIGSWSSLVDDFKGTIDEVRVSSSVRYTGNFNLYTSEFSDDLSTAGLWHLNEGSGSTTTDSSSNTNDGSISLATWTGSPPVWVPGKYGTALDFDGVEDYVKVSDHTSLDITGDITLEAWIKIDDLSTSEGWHMYIMSKDSSSSRSYGIAIDLGTYSGYHSITGGVPGFPAFVVFGSGTYATAWGTGPLTINTWYHIAATFDSSTGNLALYIDGELESTATSTISTINSGSANLRIGAREYSGHQCFFNGVIDEVRIWDKPLTECQINLAMDGKLEILPQAGLVIYKSSYHDLCDGDPVTICIISDYEITQVILNPNRGATPKKTSGSIGDVSYSSDGTSATFNVYQGDRPCKTLHAWVQLGTGEHIGVNLHFER
jgi:hypothetical protein